MAPASVLAATEEATPHLTPTPSPSRDKNLTRKDVTLDTQSWMLTAPSSVTPLANMEVKLKCVYRQR
jgi:hypothetical protein